MSVEPLKNGEIEKPPVEAPGPTAAFLLVLVFIIMAGMAIKDWLSARAQSSASATPAPVTAPKDTR